MEGIFVISWLDSFSWKMAGIKVVAYDNKENKAEDKINVIIFNIGK